MRWAAPCLLLALVVAGCGEKTAPEDPDDPFKDFESTPPVGDKGVIRGVVIDQAIQPIAGATVRIIGGQSTTSNDAGAFLISNLEPGTYFLEVSKVGYSTVQQSTDVQKGVAQPPIVKILLVHQPGSEPRAVTQTQDGIIVCSIGEPTNDHSCDTSGTQRTDLVFDFDGHPDWIQTEIHWESTQPAGDNLYVIQGVCSCDGQPSFAQRFDETSTATSLHVARADPGFLRDVDAGNSTRQVYVDVSSSGPALGTGVALDQQFSVYVTVFYNIEPAEDWTFFEQGPYPVPG